jgi:hypothetical protein
MVDLLFPADIVDDGIAGRGLRVGMWEGAPVDVQLEAGVSLSIWRRGLVRRADQYFTVMAAIQAGRGQQVR